MARNPPRYGGWLTEAEEVAREHQHSKSLDAQTANRMIMVYQALSPENQKKYREMPLDRAARIAWKL